jgi:cytochrome c553
MTPTNGLGPGRDLELGEQVYKKNCVECHGENGEGSAAEHAPAIYGQHYNYLLRQFDWIRTGKRRNADSKMAMQIRHFSMRDELAVMDYVSRLKPPAEKLAKPGWTNPDFPNFARFPGAQMQTPMPPPMRPMAPPMERPQPQQR